MKAVETANRVIPCVPGEPLIYQSSDSGGIRVWYFLSESVPRKVAFEKASDCILKAGLPLRAGVCEIRLGNSPDRLPLGLHSMLLDRFTLEPIYHLSLSETLAIAVEHRRYFSWDLRNLETSRIHQNGNWQSDYKQVVNLCLTEGLTQEYTTTECLQKLAWHGRVELRMCDEELEKWLFEWIRERHNGYSNRVSAGRMSDVSNQILRIVDRLIARPSTLRSPIRPVGLTESEGKYLLGFPCSYTVLRGAFLILAYAKSELLKASSRKVQRKSGTNKWGTDFRPDEDIPNRAHNSAYVLDLGKHTLRKLRVPWSNNTGRIVSELLRMKILSLKRKPWPDGHKVCQYWVNFPFDWSGGHTLAEFDDALLHLIGRAGIRSRFGPYRASIIGERVRAAGSIPDDTRTSVGVQQSA